MIKKINKKNEKNNTYVQLIVYNVYMTYVI